MQVVDDRTKDEVTIKLTHNEIHNLIHALNEHNTNSEILEKLNQIDENFSKCN